MARRIGAARGDGNGGAGVGPVPAPPALSGLRRRLRQEGIETGVHYRPNHTLSYFAQPDAPALPVTERVYPELLTLPLHPDLSDDDVLLVCAALRSALS